MVKRILAKFRPSPSMAVGLLGVVLALGSSGWAANGAALVLGVVNSATARTFLGANFNGTALQLSNTSAGAAATALTLSVAATRPPMAVNSTVKVAKLNADYVDGLDSTSLTRVKRVSFNLADGVASAPIMLPANVPVDVMAVATSTYGIRQIAVQRLAGQGLVWRTSDDGMHVASTVGTVIEYISAGLNIEVAGPDTIQVHNTSGISKTGSVTLMW